MLHEKFHRYNHHTTPTHGVPDSALDPIASEEVPFQGNFHLNGDLISNGKVVSSELHVQSLSASSLIANDIDINTLTVNSTVNFPSVLEVDTITVQTGSIISIEVHDGVFESLSSSYVNVDHIDNNSLSSSSVSAYSIDTDNIIVKNTSPDRVVILNNDKQLTSSDVTTNELSNIQGLDTNLMAKLLELHSRISQLEIENNDDNVEEVEVLIVDYFDLSNEDMIGEQIEFYTIPENHMLMIDSIELVDMVEHQHDVKGYLGTVDNPTMFYSPGSVISGQKGVRRTISDKLDGIYQNETFTFTLSTASLQEDAEIAIILRGILLENAANSSGD